MNIQNVKFAARTLLKNKTTTGINILGLSVGMAVSLLLISFAFNERSVDQSLKNVDDIFVLMESNDPAISIPLSNLIQKEVPEIGTITVCNYEWSPQVYLKEGQNNFKVDKLLVSDSNFFQVFPFETVWGNASEALKNKNQIVLTQSLSKQIFGDENPVGRMMAYNSTYLNLKSIRVGAVIADLPRNSSWEFDAVLPIETNLKLNWYKNLYNSWGAYNYCAFARLNEGTNPDQVEKRLEEMDVSPMPESYQDDTHVGMSPFSKAYFDLPSINEIKHGNRSVNFVTQLVGILILLLACVNYVNMVTAQRGKWVKTIGIVKSLGSSKNKVIAMVAAESSLILLLVIGVVTLTVPILISVFNQTTSGNFNLQMLYSNGNVVVLIGIIVFVWCITGPIPGYLFSRQETTSLLRKLPQNSSRKNYFRNGLLVFQFSVSIILLSSFILIGRQNKLISNNDPGFQKEHIIVASTNKDIQTKIQSFKNEVASISGITDVTFCSEPLGDVQNNMGTTMTNKGDVSDIGFASFWVSPNFFDFFGIQLKQGTSFSSNSNQNKDVIFNEKAIQQFNITSLYDARVKIDNDISHGHVIGKVEDFNFKSLHVPIGAAGFFSAGTAEDIAYFKVSATNSEDFKKAMNSLRHIWTELSPDYPFEYTSLDASWENLYRRDVEFQRMINYATIISLFLSCLGLIGLSFFVMEIRTKEIGIRKVNGARISEVMTMLNKDFVKWVAIAFVIATPIAWYAMNKWLENFAYKTSLSWWIFALAGVLALGIALLTVSWQSWKAATRNPVEALRYE